MTDDSQRTHAERATLTMSRKDADNFIKHLKRVEGARDRLVELPTEHTKGQIASLQLPPGEKGYSVHVRFVKDGSRVKVPHPHLEPDSLERPGRHVQAAMTGEEIYPGLGASMIKRKYAKFKAARCRRCGRVIWSPISLSRGYGTYCWRKL